MNDDIRLPNAFEMQFYNGIDGGDGAIAEALKSPEERLRWRQAQLAQRINDHIRDNMPPEDIEGLIDQHRDTSANLASLWRELDSAQAEVDAERETAGHRYLFGNLLRDVARMHNDKVDPIEIDRLLRLYLLESKDFHRNEGPRPMTQIEDIYCDLRPPVVHGILREGETLNVIAPPKYGKSWLVLMLALCVAAGRHWLGFRTERGSVLLLDNELHCETTAHRTPKAAERLGIDREDYDSTLFVDNLRGRLMDIHGLGKYLAQFEPRQFRLVVLDAWYKFIPAGMDENSNADMAAMYSLLDSYAHRLQCAFVCIHHATKGSQASRSVTDVGAGAGAQSRAADSHLILRQHEQDDHLVVDWVARSWPPGAPFVIRRDVPIFVPAPGLDPSDLKPDRPRPKKENNKDGETTPKETWTAERFASEFVTAEPRHKLAILETAATTIGSDRRAETLLKTAAAKKLIHPWRSPEDRRQIMFASIPEPKEAQANIPQER